MLGISGTELVIILFFGFLIFGPEKLPQMGRTVGRAIRQFRQASDSMNKKFQEEVKDPFEEAVAPIRDAANEAGAPIQDDINAINENLNGIKSTITDPFKDAFKPSSSSSASKSGAANKGNVRSSAVSTGAAAAAGTAAASTASADAPKPAAAKANPADDAFVDPFADLADLNPEPASDPGTGADASAGAASKPKGQPLPTTGGTIKKSLASSLYDLDGDDAGTGADASAADGSSATKDGE